MKFSVKLDLSEIRKMEKRIRKDVVPKIASRAMNRAIDSAATAASREISAATNIPVRLVRERLRVSPASTSRLIAELEALPFAPNLGRPFFRPTQNKAGTAATAWDRKRKTYKGAFRLPDGAVVTRTSKSRYPLKGLRGPSTRSTFMKDRILAKVDAVARQTWRTRVEHELARSLRSSL